MKSDMEIKREVLSELAWDTQVEAAEIGVEVEKGVVTLIGTASDYAAKVAACEAAQRVRAVHDVVNDIQVKIPKHVVYTDGDITHMVQQVLAWDVMIPETHIQPSVVDGWVTLKGHVDVWAQREAAERAIRHLAGVRGITNQLTVDAPKVAPQDVRQVIQEALERRAIREAEHLDITVSNGTIVLAGVVRSWLERRAIVESVAHAPGVEAVIDELQIDPFEGAPPDPQATP